MSQRIASNRGRKTGGRNRALYWILGVGLIILLLIYFEQTAILYVLATLGVTALLVIVAFADLRDMPSGEELPKANDDAAAIGTGISSTLAAQPRAQTRSSRSSRRK